MLTDNLRSIRVQAEEVGRTFDNSNFFNGELRESVSDECLDAGGIVAFVDRILYILQKSNISKLRVGDETLRTANLPSKKYQEDQVV